VTDFDCDINTVQFVHSGWLRSPFHTSKLRGGWYGKYQWLFSALNASWEKKAFQKSKLVIAVSECIKQELMEINVPAANIRVILNGVDVDEFFPGKGDRAKLGLPESVPLAMFTGDIRTPRKNLDSVLKALVKVPDLHLAVVGATARSPYPDLSQELGIADRVHFLGFRRDVPEIMKAVDFFVFPSRYEACTLVLLEALGTGIPVITAVTTGGAEIVKPECGILLSSSEDVAALADGMARLAADRELRLQMGRSARAIAEQHTWKSKAEAYNNLFEEYLTMSANS
jgi:glycosyltransferase involved in cell wall biosynthesis